MFFFSSSRFAFLPSLTSKSNVGFLFSFGRERVPPKRFKGRIRVAERPVENWFLGRGSKSGQNEMLAIFRRQTREVSSSDIASFLRGGVFQVGLDLRGRIMLGMRLCRITFSHDFHGLMIRPETFNHCNSSEHREIFEL